MSKVAELNSEVQVADLNALPVEARLILTSHYFVERQQIFNELHRLGFGSTRAAFHGDDLTAEFHFKTEDDVCRFSEVGYRSQKWDCDLDRCVVRIPRMLMKHTLRNLEELPTPTAAETPATT